MLTANFQQLIKQIADPDPNSRAAARMILISLEEDAVEPLVDEYYAGVNAAEGVAILDVLARIGGPDALNVLRNVFAYESEECAFRQASALGLLRNRSNLSLYELDEVVLYLKDNYPG